MREFISITIALFLSLGATQSAAQDQILFQYVDPLQKVLKEAAFFPAADAVATVARGEYASFQFVLRADQALGGAQVKVTFSPQGQRLQAGTRTGFVGYVRVGRATPSPSRDRLMPPSGYYPDPILDNTSMDIPAHTSQPIWISVAIPQDMPAGDYTAEIQVEARYGKKAVVLKRPFTVQVYPVTITGTRLWFTNWFTMGDQVLKHLNGGQSVAQYSPRYWELLRTTAKMMAEYRQNVVLLSPLRLAEYKIENGTYRFDFSKFDQSVKIFEEEGVLGLIEGGHIGGRESHWTSPFVVDFPVLKEGAVVFTRKPISDPAASNFYTQFIPALVAHLKQNGWYDNYLQHIADEPITENIQSYIEIATFVKSLAPDIRIIEACHSKDLGNTVDVWVPQLDFFHIDNEFYKARSMQGDEVWFYTCLAPQGEYANRFVELPALKTRVLFWLNYRYNSPGYLHWGLNFWNDNPFDETTGIITESGNVLPGGDAWVVYPGKNKFLSSIRLEATRDGIFDNELLHMLHEKNPAQAQEIARQTVYLFDRYDLNIEAFRNRRRKILELLAQ
ncbi:MAG: hypothetical protein RL386_1757 [Bacteroidota bacterium]|jgi:hypothetical protein